MSRKHKVRQTEHGNEVKLEVRQDDLKGKEQERAKDDEEEDTPEQSRDDFVEPVKAARIRFVENGKDRLDDLCSLCHKCCRIDEHRLCLSEIYTTRRCAQAEEEVT